MIHHRLRQFSTPLKNSKSSLPVPYSTHSELLKFRTIVVINTTLKAIQKTRISDTIITEYLPNNNDSDEQNNKIPADVYHTSWGLIKVGNTRIILSSYSQLLMGRRQKDQPPQCIAMCPLTTDKLLVPDHDKYANEALSIFHHCLL